MKSAQEVSDLRSRHESMADRFRWFSIYCVAPLAVGGLIYALRRVMPSGNAFMGSGPSFFWMFATISWVAFIWRDRPGVEGWTWIALAASLGPASEFAQRIGWMPGTFDPLDLVFGVAGSLLALSGLTEKQPCGDVAA